MTQKPNQVLEDLKAGNYHPVYFLQGDEPYYIDSISNYIESHALDESEKGFNQMIMYGKDSSIDTILINARRFPMMASRQVVIVKEAQEITNFNRQEAQKLLQSYLEAPLSSTILVFCYKYKTLDKRKSITKSIMEHALLVDCKKLYDNQVPDWILGYVKLKNATIDPVTAQLLSDYIGNNLERLSSEIDKVLLNLPEPSNIDTAVVQKYIGISKDYNVFELQKALAAKDNVKAHRIVQYFTANPRQNPIIPIIALLFSFFSKLLVVQHSKSTSERDLARKLNLRPYFLKEYMSAARLYSAQQVVDNISHLRTADLKAKGVGIVPGSHGEVLKELVFKLLN